jgi:hypothetical protein
MKTSNSGPPCSKSEEPVIRTRLGRLKKALRNFKSRMKGKKKKTRITSSGLMRGQWKQEELPRIVKKIVDKNPGLTSIEIYGNEIRWHCEINYFDLFPRKKGNENPSKREEEKII